MAQCQNFGEKNKKDEVLERVYKKRVNRIGTESRNTDEISYEIWK